MKKCAGARTHYIISKTRDKTNNVWNSCYGNTIVLPFVHIIAMQCHLLCPDTVEIQIMQNCNASWVGTADYKSGLPVKWQTFKQLTRKRESKNEYLGDTVCPPVRGYSSKGRCWYVKKYCKYYIIMNSVRMFAATYIDHYIHVFCIRIATHIN